MLSNLLFWAYTSSAFTLKEEVTSRTNYYYEGLYRNIHGRKQKKESIDLNKLKDSIQKGVKWLESMQRDDGCIGGRLWEVWDTVNAVLALASTGIESNSTDRSVNFLLRGQLESGGFFYERFPPSREDVRHRTDLYCIETTPVALMGIYKYKREITPEIKKGVNFLYKIQGDCGGWELPYLGERKSVNTNVNYFPSVTGYALRAILLDDKNFSRPVLEKALSFIEKTQYRDGSWGRSYRYYNTEGYAIRNMVSALTSMKTLECTEDTKLRIEKILNSAISYAKRMQNPDGSWSAISIASKAVSTSLYLQALLIAKDNDRNSINLAADWLLKNQEEKGFWKGGYYGHLVHPYLGFIHEVNNDVFATSEALVALSEFKKLYKVI